jgi:hypothetical protein
VLLAPFYYSVAALAQAPQPSLQRPRHPAHQRRRLAQVLAPAQVAVAVLALVAAQVRAPAPVRAAALAQVQVAALAQVQVAAQVRVRGGHLRAVRRAPEARPAPSLGTAPFRNLQAM